MTIEQKLAVRLQLMMLVGSRLDSEKTPDRPGISDVGVSEITEKMEREFGYVPREELWHLLVSLAAVYLRFMQNTDSEFEVLSELIGKIEKEVYTPRKPRV